MLLHLKIFAHKQARLRFKQSFLMVTFCPLLGHFLMSTARYLSTWTASVHECKRYFANFFFVVLSLKRNGKYYWLNLWKRKNNNNIFGYFHLGMEWQYCTRKFCVGVFTCAGFLWWRFSGRFPDGREMTGDRTDTEIHLYKYGKRTYFGRCQTRVLIKVTNEASP